jgi:predicted NBD/HSP70 family sugar kinase
VDAVDAADRARPSLELLRSLTDEHVLRALMGTRQLTRAELATLTGISKPTVGESVRRLAGAGLVADTGERTRGGRGRGRVGSYYALAPGVGVALAASIAPEGIVAECVDVYGEVVSRAARTTGHPARPDEVADALRSAVLEATGNVGRGVRLAVVSAADPVDRGTGRLVHLPDSPFLIGELDPVAVLTPHVGGPVTVDNDVNWAAAAERDAAAGRDAGQTAGGGRQAGLSDFGYVFLGEGLGGAIVSGGEVTRGHSGLAGELAHLITTGPGQRAMPFVAVFGELRLRQAGSSAIDTGRLLRAATGPEPGAGALRDAIGQAVSGVVAALASLADPEVVIIGGPWGSHPVVLEAVTAALAGRPRRVALRAASVIAEPSLAGARGEALRRLRAAIVSPAGVPWLMTSRALKD